MTPRETNAFDARKVTDKRLIELITATTPARASHAEMVEALKLLRKDSSVTVPKIKRLMSTGSSKARELVASSMRRNFTFITEARKWEDRDPQWKWRCELVWNPTITQDLMRKWVLGNVIDEVAQDYDDSLVIAGIDAAAHGIKTSGYPSALQADTEAYWRGLTAFFLSKVVYRNDKSLRARAQAKARYDFYANVDEFIEWAGNHPDINSVIATAQQRKSIVVSTLKEIMAQGATAPAVGSGAI